MQERLPHLRTQRHIYVQVSGYSTLNALQTTLNPQHQPHFPRQFQETPIDLRTAYVLPQLRTIPKHTTNNYASY